MNTPIPTLSESDLTRFWSKVDKSGECWLWMAYLNWDGYGQSYIDRIPFKAHRISYAIANGDPGELNVNHTCDTPACVNPAHLWAGTQQEGMDDKVAKDRQDKGETHGSAKLTEEQVREILASDESQYTLANRYGVAHNTIWSIKCGRTWKHLEVKE